ncbi:MAG: Cof-type HAD-IIB family hydrolase [Liquorilactobacillus ghanensis]|uniref:Cof-type HAD-IIB family hydrolase n=1 Tax=Liquorilactobacillus ghanensis TaxID=399370 RepID=UPI0039EA5755
MAYKMVVCDLDETLLNDKKLIPAVNIAAIKAAVAQGIYFVPNTGRGYLTVQDNLQTLGLFQQKNEYVISYNGGAIVENFNNQILQTCVMPFSVVESLFELGIAQGYCVHVYTVDQLYIWNISASEINYLTGRVNQWHETTEPNLDFLRGQDLIKIIFFVPQEAERLALKEQVLAQYTYPLNISFSSDRYIEFNSIEADKGQAAIALGKRLNIKPTEIIAVGDNSNDLPMIRQAGLGVSVANGRKFVKQAADYITAADNNQGAVAEVLRKFVL